MRLVDVAEGDVVNARPDKEEGWFVVAKKHRLFSGEIQLTDYNADKTISGNDFEIVGVQFVSDADVPEQPPIPPKFLVFNDGSTPTEQDVPQDEESTDEAEAEADGEAGSEEAAAAPAPAQPITAGAH